MGRNTEQGAGPGLLSMGGCKLVAPDCQGFAADFSLKALRSQPFGSPGWTWMEEGLRGREASVSVLHVHRFPDAEAVQRQDPGFRAGLTWAWSRLCV